MGGVRDEERERLLKGKVRKGEKAHQHGRQRGKAHGGAALDDGPAAAAQVHHAAVAAVQPDLPRGEHEDAVCRAGDVRGAGDGAAEDEAVGEVGGG